MEKIPKIAQLRTVEAFRARLDHLNIELPVDEVVLSAEEQSPMAQPMMFGPYRVGNRWCIHPMEGWDGHLDGSPSEKTLRRWKHFGSSGAKLLWGGEAAAILPSVCANPNQIIALEENRAGLQALFDTARNAHRERFETVDDLVMGLQLTHSGRYSHREKPMPKIAYHHPYLDQKSGIDPSDNSVVITDSELEQLPAAYVAAAKLTKEVGFQFVDIKCCHGYLLHELLSARSRPGPFGGDFQGRTRLLKMIIEKIQDEVPDLVVGVRLSIFDSLPFEPGDKETQQAGQPISYQELLPYDYGFGINRDNPLKYDLTEPFQLLRDLNGLGVAAVNISCGCPYYNAHTMRPAIFPPSDGYLPPEDPLVGVARMIEAARQCREVLDAEGIEMPLIGTGYSYLQDYLPHVAQGAVRSGWIDSVGIGRMVLSYPELPADMLAGRPYQRKKICRTFSDCTTAPRNALPSGCYPLDPFYKAMPEFKTLREIKSK